MLTPSYIGSELTRKGVCEQAEHVMSPQEYMRVEYDITMKTQTNQPMLKYRCSEFAIFIFSIHSKSMSVCVRQPIGLNVRIVLSTSMLHFRGF